MKRQLLILFLIVIFISFANAEVVLKTNQSEYYFLVGKPATISFDVSSDFNVSGVLSFSSTTKIQQQNMAYSSTNSNSQNFNAIKGTNSVGLNLGTANSPSEMDLDIKYNYNDKNGKAMIATMPTLKVFFVSDDKQKKNQQNPQQSSSQSQEEQQKQQQEEQQKQAEERQKQMEKQMQQQKVQNQMQNRLQNNQINQDSQNLKNQMQEQQKTNQEFAKNLASQKKFQEMHNELMKQGYNQSDANINAQNNETGDFDIKYKKPNGDSAEIKGSMNNNTIQNIEKHSKEDENNLLKKLKEDPRFQKYNSNLQSSGYNSSSPNIQTNGNETDIDITYTNQNNQTAEIKSIIENSTVTSVKLEKPSHFFSYLIFVIFLGFLIAGFFIYSKYYKKKPEIAIVKEVKKKPIDFKKEALKLLSESKKLFSEKKFKDAYSKASEAVRFYYSYKFKLEKEITSSELISYLKKNKVSYSDVQKCLNLCSMVEFAKYEANKKDFDEIVKIGKRVII